MEIIKMDRELVDNLVKVVLDNKENKNNAYNHLDKLLVTLSDEEINYFLEQCGDEGIFSNYDLFFQLSITIPEKMKNVVETFVNKKLYIINLMEESLKVEYSKGRISQELYEETMKEYDEVRTEGNKFLEIYLIEIEKELKNKK